ncbi:hypothetical protein DV735_g5118, partial [Chaetothyriales sp. CBS 134920]
MSYILWKSLIEHDVEAFRQQLSGAAYSSTTPKTRPGASGSQLLQVGSPNALATSPRTSYKTKRSPSQAQLASSRIRAVALSRADINARDSFGRTLLHHASSLQQSEAYEYVKALLETPYLDLYVQDTESGWTALHRALYFGNVSVAHALMQRDVRDATDYTTQASRAHAGGLIKIKDHEGNSPFEVFGLTIARREIQPDGNELGPGTEDDGSTDSVDLNDDPSEWNAIKREFQPLVNLQGDESFVFGSNKNLTLGTGDEDDRHLPDRLQLHRPEHVIRRLYEDHLLERSKTSLPDDLSLSIPSAAAAADLPFLIRNKPVRILNVVMSKLHTAVLTDDPISNLYICGFGVGGRLGTGDDTTAFSFKPILGGGLSKHRISTVALGQDHTIAICSQGEVFTWGSNKFGQLGYLLPEVKPQEIPVQLSPRQLYGLVKRERIVGAAASSIHSALYTSHSLYTFGKNEGQLGFMDADARSLETQTQPRRVAPSVLHTAIQTVSAIDRATTVLLENHDVIVFTHYGWTKVVFQLDIFHHPSLSQAQWAHYNPAVNFIKKVTSGGNTICALSSFGEVFTIDVPKVSDSVPSSMSTTNPSKARNALPSATRVWSIRKDHMSAMDVAVSGQDGSIILCTTSGSVWRKEKRANIQASRDQGRNASRPKDYKFVRAPNLTRAVAVRSNAFGAFAAVRRESDVTRTQIVVEPPSLWKHFFQLLSFRHYGDDKDDTEPPTRLSFWRPGSNGPSPAMVKRALITRSTGEDELTNVCRSLESLSGSGFDAWITSDVTDVRIPVHCFVLQMRSRVLRSALTEFRQTYYFEVADVLSIEYGRDGQTQLKFLGADLLTLVNIALYFYTDEVLDVWHFTSKALQSAARYRAVRTEVMKIAAALELYQLERATRLMVDPAKSLCLDAESSFQDDDLFSDADVILDLADGAELAAHSVLLCQRCPFFDGLFNGMAGGMWMSSRRGVADEKSEAMRVDLTHVGIDVFTRVLRHLYADTGVELFDDIVADSFDQFADFVIEVLSVANELMLDRLSQICQAVLGNFVTMRNVCGLLNAVAECSVTQFKEAALEFICLNLEGMMEQRLLDELGPELMAELDEVVRQNQQAFMPFARSGRAEAELVDRNPELLGQIEQGRQRRADSMRLRSRLAEDEARSANYQKARIGSFEQKASPQAKSKPGFNDTPSPGPSPAISARDGKEDLQFEMEDDSVIGSPSLGPCPSSPGPRPRSLPQQELDELDELNDQLAGSLAGRSSLSPRPDSGPLGLGLSPQNVLTTPKYDRGSGKPAWQASPQAGEKLNLREIMEQASVGRASAITQSLGRASVAPSKPPTKVSQKERKKKQHELKMADTQPATSTANQASGSSPWQKTGPSNKPNAASAAPGAESPSTSKPTRTAMTMRQTVAGSRSSEDGGQARVGSTKPARGVASTSSPKAPVIQSIRHTPQTSRRRLEMEGQTSMVEILSQQHLEKASLKEAAAKRSLQEIQQEQEFQEWWDKETSASSALSRQTNPTHTNNSRDREGPGLRTAGSLATGSSDDLGPSRDGQLTETAAAQLQRLNQVIQNFHTKAVLIILRSRVELRPAFSKNTDQRRVNKWFNIELDETDDYREDIRRWRQCDVQHDRPPPLVIEVFLATDQLQQGQRLVMVDDDGKRWDVVNALASSSSSPHNGNSSSRRRATDSSELLLERWTIELGEGPASLPPDLANLLPLVYKKSIVLFRSLFTYCNFLPAWKLARKVGKSRSTMAMRMGYRILDASSTHAVSRSDNLSLPLSDSSADVTADYRFGSTESPAGTFSVSVTYRHNCDFRIDDSEELLSSRFLGVDDDLFRPSLPSETTGSQAQTGMIEAGSLPADKRRHLYDRPDLSQAYGSLTTFHQAGTASGASPITTLRNAQDYSAQSPPAAERARPQTVASQPSSQSSRAALQTQAARRRSSFGFQPFKTPTLSASPLGLSPLGTSPRTSVRGPVLGSLTEESGPPRPNAAAVAARKPASLTSEHAGLSSTSSSPRPPITGRYSSSFSHRRARLSSGGTTTRTDEDQASSGRASAASSAQPGSGLLTDAAGGVAGSGSMQEDDENIKDFLKMLDTKKDLLNPEDASLEGATRRTNAALSRFHHMRDSNAALSESMTSSLMLHRSSSSSSRQISSVPPMVAATSASTSSSPGKPISPHTPHTPFAPSRLSAAYSHDDEVEHHLTVQEAPASPSEAATSDTAQARSTTHVPAIDIPNSPRLFLPGYRRSSSAQRRPLSEDDIGDLYGMRSASMGAQDRRQRVQAGSDEQAHSNAHGDGETAAAEQSSRNRRLQTTAAGAGVLASDGTTSDSGSGPSSAAAYQRLVARGAGRGVTPPQGSTSSFGGAGSVDRSGESGSASDSWARSARRRSSRPEANADDEEFLPFAMEKSERF